MLIVFQRLLLGAIYSQRMVGIQHMKCCKIKDASILLEENKLEPSRKTHSLTLP